MKIHTNKLKVTKNYLSTVCAVVIIVGIAVFGVHYLTTTTNAASNSDGCAVGGSGDACFALNPSSGSYTVGNTLTVQITETSSAADNVNGVQADLQYPTSLLQYDSTSINGPFTLVGQNTVGSGVVEIGIASTSTQSGTVNVADITFTVLASGSTNTTSSSPDYLGMTSGTNGSDIVSDSGASVWNGVLPGATFTLNAPVSPPPSSGSNTSGKTSGSGGSTSSGSSKSSSSTKSSSSSTQTTTTPTPATTPAATTTTPAATTSTLGSLSVTVTNAQGKTISGAKVTLDNQQTVLTNSYGVANFSGVKSGTHTVTVSQAGVKKSTQTQLSLTKGENKLLDIKLAGSSSGGSYVSLVIFAVIVIILLGAGSIGFRFFRNKSKPSAPTAVISSITPSLSGDSNIAPDPTVITPSQPPATPIVQPQANETSKDQGETIIHPTEPRIS
jgi:hypothetical protein